MHEPPALSADLLLNFQPVKLATFDVERAHLEAVAVDADDAVVVSVPDSVAEFWPGWAVRLQSATTATAHDVDRSLFGGAVVQNWPSSFVRVDVPGPYDVNLVLLVQLDHVPEP